MISRSGDGGLLHKLGANSAIYAATNLLQKGASFLLLPLYTRYLDPSAFGVLAVVTSINGLLAITFTLSLTSAVMRFYFEHRDDSALMAEFWGSILMFIMLLSLTLGGLLLAVGDMLLAPLAQGVAFWPFLALGVLATLFQPIFTTFLTLLQTRNEASSFALVSLAHFALTTALTVALVVLLGWGVIGALTATLIGAAVFFCVALWMLREHVRPCLKWRHLREALSYSLPQLPHTVAGQLSAVTDRLVLNARLGTSAAGLYSVGAMLAMAIEVAAQSVNRAYVPLGMEALKRRTPQDLAQLRGIGALVVATFCLLGVTVAAFSSDLIALFAAPAFAAAVAVVPILVFVGVASAIYYLFVNVLFYDRAATKLIPLGTLTAAGFNVVLVMLLVPPFGLIGAAAATLLAQCVATLLTAVLGKRFDPVAWDYPRYAVAFVGSLALALWIGSREFQNSAIALTVKLAAVGGAAAVLGTLFWRRPLIFGSAVVCLLRRRFAAAAALFTTNDAEVAT